MVTMGDIAKKAGVSTVTVSKALNDKEGVSAEVKMRIKEMAIGLILVRNREMGVQVTLLS